MMQTLETIKKLAKFYAEHIQEKAPEMTGSELYAEETFVPNFDATRQYLNFSIGYVCKSAEGRLVKLIQPYDSTIYTEQPEALPAQWGFYWSTDPSKALPFISVATSPYNTGDCCVHNEKVYRSLIDNNTWSPSDYAQGWEEVTN